MTLQIHHIAMSMCTRIFALKLFCFFGTEFLSVRKYPPFCWILTKYGLIGTGSPSRKYFLSPLAVICLRRIWYCHWRFCRLQFINSICANLTALWLWLWLMLWRPHDNHLHSDCTIPSRLLQLLQDRPEAATWSPRQMPQGQCGMVLRCSEYCSLEPPHDFYAPMRG